MEDVQRFLRYTIPGLVLLIQVSIYLLFSLHKQFLDFVKDLQTGPAIFSFIASGGIGYFLSTLYHWLYWKRLLRKNVINHTSLFRDAVDRGWMKFSNSANGEDITEEIRKNLTQKRAWRFSSVVWLEKLGTSKTFEGANDRIDRLIHIMHSLGITLIGSVIAFPVWLFIHYKLSENNFPNSEQCLRTIPVIILIFLIHLDHFRKVVKDFEVIINTVTSDALQDECIRNNYHPAIINVASSELEELRKEQS